MLVNSESICHSSGSTTLIFLPQRQLSHHTLHILIFKNLITCEERVEVMHTLTGQVVDYTCTADLW